MGQQSNKIIKRRRRLARVKRKKEAVATAKANPAAARKSAEAKKAAVKKKPAAKKPAAKKVEAAPAPAPVEETAAPEATTEATEA